MLNVGAVVHKVSCPLIRLALHTFFHGLVFGYGGSNGAKAK